MDNPLQCISEDHENLLGQTDDNSLSLVNQVLIVPLHTQEWSIVRIDRHVVICKSSVDLRQQCPPSELQDTLHCIFHRDVVLR